MLRGMDPAKENLADNEEIQVRSYSIFRSVARTENAIAGIVSVVHVIETQDCQTN